MGDRLSLIPHTLDQDSGNMADDDYMNIFLNKTLDFDRIIIDYCCMEFHWS